MPEPTLIAITQLQLLAHLYKWQTDLGFIDSYWILEFPLHLLGGVAPFVTVPRSFPLEVHSPWSWAGWWELQHLLESRHGGCRRFMLESVGWELLGITSPPTSPMPLSPHNLPPWPAELHGAMWFQEGPYSPAMGKGKDTVCFCAVAEDRAPCWGAIFEGVTWHSSGAGAETAGSTSCFVLG